MIQTIWQEFLKIVREEVGSRVVETWFKAVTLDRWDAIEKVVYLKAPNAFVRDWVCKHYLSLFQLHLGRLLNVERPKVIFVEQNKVKKDIEVDPAQGKDVEKNNKTHIPQTYKAAHVVSTRSSNARNALVKTLSNKSYGHINRNYVFETFVVGPSNSLAYAACHAVIKKPGRLYNPMFIYGDSGLGKTHLLHAIGNGIKQTNKHAVVLYQTADRFVSEFINAIRFDKIHKFQKKYQLVDVLLVDDIQFISNKEQTQEAFFHIFNSLYDAHKQIIFSSDTFPQNIHGIAERLRSRLAWGLVTDIRLPSLETKIAILKKKVEISGEVVSDEVAHFIASRVISNIRELEGALIRVTAFATLTGQPITMELAKKVLLRSEQGKKQLIDCDRVIKCIVKHYPYSFDALCSKNRNKDLVFVRQVTMFLMKKLTSKSLRDIGRFLGGRNHTTVKHAVKKMERHAQEYPGFLHQLQQIEKEIFN